MSAPIPQAQIDQLAKLIHNDQLVLFVGAGISLQAPTMDGSKQRMPLWYELGERVAKACGESLGHYNDSLMDLFDAIAANQDRNTLEAAVKEALNDENFQPSSAHYSLATLPWNMVVTTNYDSLLDRAIHEKYAIDADHKYEWLSREKEKRPRLVHLHGSIAHPHTLTGTDYGEWKVCNPQGYAFLESCALNKTILFVGYSFSDPHLKLGLLPWIKKATAGRGKRHHAWMWNVSPEQIRLLDKRDQIDVVTVKKDEDWAAAFEQLADKLKSIAKPSTRRTNIAPVAPVFKHSSAVVNGYKLFFFRNSKGLSVGRLSNVSGVDTRIINGIEQVKTKIAAGPNCFSSMSRDDLARLEHALGCIGQLEYGQGDDFLAKFIMYYKVNKVPVRKAAGTQPLDFKADTKAVVFDFGGTLTISNSQLSTWERMWNAVGYTTEEAGHFHRRFLARGPKRISHQEWCNITAEKLRAKKFSRTHMKSIIETIEPVAGLHQAITALHNQGSSLYIVSGSIREIIASVLGSTYSLFTEVHANELKYDDDGVIENIKGHSFDFEGKAKFLERVFLDQRCESYEVLFVGNSLNDTWASLSGARTLCVNPSDVDFTNTVIWSDYLKPMGDLTEVLPFATRQPVKT